MAVSGLAQIYKLVMQLRYKRHYQFILTEGNCTRYIMIQWLRKPFVMQFLKFRFYWREEDWRWMVA
ncbi:hypothetical protein B1A85_08640 [Chroococcidiopsis sp. TS-821]|nr:hypothetical protein B1A85_08640 [Chroococcidiopsis sp. TS-821]